MNGWRVIHQRKAEHRTCKEHSMNMFFKPQHPKIPNCAGETSPGHFHDGSTQPFRYGPARCDSAHPSDWGDAIKGPFWPLVVITFHDASIQSHPDTRPVKCESAHLSERGNVTRGPFWPLVVTTFHDASLEGHPDTGPVRSESPHLSEWGNGIKGPFGHWW